MADRRRAELEEKRAKLAELRRARDERKAQLAQQDQGGVVEPLTTARRDVNDLVDSLVGPSSSRPNTPYAGSSLIPTPAVPASVSRASGRATPVASIPPTPARPYSRLSNEESAGERRSGSALGHSGSRQEEALFSPGNAVDYIEHSAELYELPTKPVAKPVITYSKAIQTSMGTSTLDVEAEDSLDEAGPSRSRKKNLQTDDAGRETEDEMRQRILAELEQERKVVEAELQELKVKGEALRVAELSNEQKQAIFAAPEFAAFFEHSTKIVQRALSDAYDYTKDYTVGLDGAFDDEGQKVKLLCGFADERWTNGRSVTDLDWSAKHPELLVASYNKSSTLHNDPDGIVAVWNVHLLDRPEFIFHSPSDVLAVAFAPYHPTLVFGGTYSGQVLLWDTRAKHLPVLKTPLSASGHTYPIYSIKMIGTQNASNLVTASTDGMVCSWQLDMLAHPQESLLLSAPTHSKTDEVSITCFDSATNDAATLWIGTEEGSVYQANRYDRPSTKAGLVSAPEDIYRGHAGPITGLHFHPGTGNIDFSDLFLTASVDWTVKLWRAKGQKSQAVLADKAAGVRALHTFEEAADYVFDVKWHPQHPALFGAVDGTGKFDLWNLNQDVEVPITSTQVSDKAINKLAWDKTTGSRKVGLGSSDGKLYVYDVSEKVVTPREAEWVEMQKMVQGLTASRGI